MTPHLLRILEHVHGHLGWLAAASLLHPAIVLRHRERRAHLAVGLATAFVTVAGALGAWLYPSYRAIVKQPLFVEARSIGFLFERKEHLAFGAILLAWAGAIAYVAAIRAESDTRMALRAIAFRAFVFAAFFALLAAVFGTIVASYRTF